MAAFDRSTESPLDCGLIDGPLQSIHRGADDLLSAGLGLDGLRSSTPPAVDAQAPSAAQLRRLAIWCDWRGIVDLSASGGFARVYGAAPDRSLPLVPGREYRGFARVPGARQPHRVLAQIPDHFDRARRCLVVAPSSGSRGVYGAIGFAGGWALPRGAAVVYTDKGAGSDAFDCDHDEGVRLDGTRARRGEAQLAFAPERRAFRPHSIAVQHAHSGDNPEADWPRHVWQALAFGLDMLAQAYPEQAPFTVANTRVILAAMSNGAGAVLRAAEWPQAAELAAVVAIAPQLHVQGAAPLFDYATLAGLYQRLALLDPRLADAPSPLTPELRRSQAQARAQALAAAGLLQATGFGAQAAEAFERLQAAGFTLAAQRAGAINTAFDLWRSLAATYVSAYARGQVGDDLCGYRFAALDPAGRARPTGAAERARWIAEHNGIAPSGGIGIVDALVAGLDPALPGIACARRAWTGSDALAVRVRAGLDATRATGRACAPRVLIVHGGDDGLVPAALTSMPWYDAARNSAAGELSYLQVENVQHFDAFLAHPALAAAWLPLLPYAWAALDRAWQGVLGDPLPPSATLHTTPRGLGADGAPVDLDAANLGLGQIFQRRA